MQTISVNLAALKGAYIGELTDGRKAVIIPDTDCFIPKDQKGDKPVASVSLNIYTHLPNQYGFCLSVKQNFRREELEKMTDAERQNLPFVGRGK